MTGGVFTVLELDGPRISAASANVTREGVEVKQWLSAVRPDTVAADNAEAVGAWVAQELERAKIPRKRVVLSVSRGDVVLKSLHLPTGRGASEADLAGAVRLAMARQLTMALEGSAIDYAPMTHARVGEATPPTTLPAASGGGAGSVASDADGAMRAVMAGAMPADRVRWYREMASAAGVKLKRIGLRCFGASALLAELSQRKGGTMLGIAMGWGSTEFVIVEDGEMVFARATDTPRPVMRAEVDGFAERIAVEARRTWMSHKASKPNAELELVAILGEGELLKRVSEKVGPSMEARCEIIGTPALVQVPASMPESERSATAPLIGLLVEQVLRRPMLDFANPRKLPDRGAKRRQLALASVLGLIVFGGFGLVLARQQLDSLDTDLKSEQSRLAELRGQYETFLATQARGRHIDQWLDSGVDWLAHVSELSVQMPDPRLAVVDDLGGTLSSDVIYVPRSRGARYPDGNWSVSRDATFSVSGRVKDRNTALDLRGRLVGGNLYNVESRGADVSDRFSYLLTTSAVSPQARREAIATAEKEAAERAAGTKKPAPAKGKSTPAPKKDAAPKADAPKQDGPKADAAKSDGATQEIAKNDAQPAPAATPTPAPAPAPANVEVAR
jgi:Tfp pilus assembly PilM family ATPase